MRVIEWIDACNGTMRCCREDNFSGAIEVSETLLVNEARGEEFVAEPQCLLILSTVEGYEEHCWSSTSYTDIVKQLRKSDYIDPSAEYSNNADGNKNIKLY